MVGHEQLRAVAVRPVVELPAGAVVVAPRLIDRLPEIVRSAGLRLLTHTSIGPNASSISVAVRSRRAKSATSAGTASAVPPGRGTADAGARSGDGNGLSHVSSL
jgi:hypothetical protein